MDGNLVIFGSTIIISIVSFFMGYFQQKRNIKCGHL